MPAQTSLTHPQARLLHAGSSRSEWWHSAVFYQIYPRSFASSGAGSVPGIGDLPGITSRLEHIAQLGADAIWLSPFYTSPQKDAGYDVADYRGVDPIFGGDIQYAQDLFERAHELGLRVIVDLVGNHSSDQHPWFQAALRGGPEAPERDLYWFRPGTGENGDNPPTDWQSVFRNSAWTRVCDRADAPGSPWENDKSWYLNMFDSSQPDFNWSNPVVLEEFDSILRFWLDLGADGFRVDVAHGMVKDPALPNWNYDTEMVSGEERGQIPPAPMWNQPGVHDIFRRWHEIFASYEGDRMIVAEAWVSPQDGGIENYVRPDELSQSFNFDFLTCPWTSGDLRRVIAYSLETMDKVGAPTTWVLSNHDVVRAASRMGLAETGKGPNGIAADSEQPDAALGLARARAAHTLMQFLPGSAYVYQGEELGLPEHTSLPHEVRQDPAFFRSEGAEIGRDGCRIPLPWEATAPAFGFSPSGDAWLPQPAEWAALAVDAQLADPQSHLHWYQELLALRKSFGLAHGALFDLSGLGEFAAFELALENQAAAGTLVCATAFDMPVALPAGWDVVFASAELDADANGNLLVPANSTVWLQRK